MFTEHMSTDRFLAEFQAQLGPDCGVVAVKQDGAFEGTGPFARFKPDFFVFPSGMQVSTDAVAYNSRWGWSWYLASLAAVEKQMFDTREQHISLTDGRSATKAIETLSPCLDKFR